MTEDIQDDDGTVYAAWMRRKPTVHDTALTGGDGPRMHHVAFATHEKHNILAICDKLGALRLSDRIERGPGRHGVSNAFYLYLRDPDGHRIEIYTQDYYTGDPDNPVVTWDVHDNQRRDWWGNPVVPSWYTEALARARPRRQPAAGRRAHRRRRDGGHDRRRRVLLHARGRGDARVQARQPALPPGSRCAECFAGDSAKSRPRLRLPPSCPRAGADAADSRLVRAAETRARGPRP